MLDFLKTMPDMTTQEITMIETPKIPMTKRIRDYKAANPDATAKEIAEAVGTTAVYVYQILAVPAKKAAPAKSTPKAASANTVSVKEHDALVRRLAEQTVEVMELEEEIVGLRAVVKYLEEKLNGTPV
jgi:restriction endonuclease Mrr